MRRALASAVDRTSHLWDDLELAWLKKQVWRQPPGALVRYKRYTIRINDGPNAYIGIKDIFARRIYHFESRRPDPLIIDCGSNIGLSILYFARAYPQGRIIGFEPDPTIVPYLQENMALNDVNNAQVTQAAVAARAGVMTLYSEGLYGSCVSERPPVDLTPGASTYEVLCVRLRDYLTEPVDFLKMNIEGAEWEVLADSADCLPRVDQMVIEYHHLPGLPRTLPSILALLDQQGFEFLINDFDSLTNPGTLPPFRLDPSSRYFLLIYARRRGSEG